MNKMIFASSPREYPLGFYFSLYGDKPSLFKWARKFIALHLRLL